MPGRTIPANKKIKLIAVGKKANGQVAECESYFWSINNGNFALSNTKGKETTLVPKGEVGSTTIITCTADADLSPKERNIIATKTLTVGVAT